MKLFATLALAAMTAVPLFAASIPRCDITGLDKAGKVKLTPGKIEGGLRVSNQNWGAEETRPFRLTAAGKAIGPEWTRCKLTFIPENSGKLQLALCGQAAKKVEDRGWLTVTNLSINGKLVPNADLKKVYERNGKQIPNGFWFNRNPVYVSDGGPDGAAGVTVNHDNRLIRPFMVEAGKPVTIEFMAKAAEAPAK